MLLKISFPSFFLLAYFSGLALSAKNTCQLEAVWGRYEADCNFQGSFKKPSVLKKYHYVDQLDTCASNCYYNDKCVLFQFNSDTNSCTLYDKYKDQMGYESKPAKSTQLYYEKLCYSTSCNVIEACNSYHDCDYEYVVVDRYYGYSEFGCSYGVEAKFPKPTKIKKQFLIPSAKTTCDAVYRCAEAGAYGTFVVAYFKPKKQWMCTTYDNACLEDYDCHYSPKYDYDFTMDAEHISRTTFMYKNSSIGATVAYWQVSSYY